MDASASSFDTNPLVKELLAAGSQVIPMDGYIGPTEQDRIRFYQDLSLSHYLEIPKRDIVRVITLSGRTDGRVRVYFKTTAELQLHTVVTMKASDILSTLASVQSAAPCSGSTASPETGAIARVNPPDNCYGGCEMSWRACVSRHEGDLWCAAKYAGCVLLCTFTEVFGSLEALP